MARLFNPDDLGKSNNCLMYAISDFVADAKRAEVLFKKLFRENGGNGANAFEQLCWKLNLRCKITSFSSANIAIQWFIYKEYQIDYEGLSQLVRSYPDYHVIKKNGVWMEKNECYSECQPTPVPANELAEWKAGSAPDKQFAFYAISG